MARQEDPRYLEAAKTEYFAVAAALLAAQAARRKASFFDRHSFQPAQVATQAAFASLV